MPTHVHFNHLVLEGFTAAEQAELVAGLQAAVQARMAARGPTSSRSFPGASLEVAAGLPVAAVVEQAMQQVFSPAEGTTAVAAGTGGLP